jgi:hypothetical protein
MDFDLPNEDSSPENVRIRSVLDQLGGVLQSNSPVDWQGSRRWCCEVLAPLTELPEGQRLVEMFEGAPYIVGGDEHHLIRTKSEPGRFYKFTHGDNFGCRTYFSKHDPELTGRHFHGTGNADPFFYLRRWYILNALGGFQTRFEGIVPPEISGHLPRFCVSQGVLRWQSESRRNPTEEEIERALIPFGFQKVSTDAFLNIDTRILLTDTAPRNVRVFDGIPVPFDAGAEIASDEVLEWALERFGVRKRRSNGNLNATPE